MPVRRLYGGAARTVRFYRESTRRGGGILLFVFLGQENNRRKKKRWQRPTRDEEARLRAGLRIWARVNRYKLLTAPNHVDVFEV